MGALWSKIPDEIKAALVALVLTNIAALSAAIKSWLTRRLYQGAFENQVQAIETSGSVHVSDTVRRANVKDGIEDKVKPLVQAIKSEMPASATNPDGLPNAAFLKGDGP